MPAKKTKTPELPKKKSGCLKYVIILILFLIFGRYLSFWDFPYFDILHYLRPEMTFEQTMKLINPLPAKGYQYPQPSVEALNRTVNCSDLYSLYEFPRSNSLCLNMFQTSPEDITQKLSEGSYDRIVFYGERSVFDAPVSFPGHKNYVKDLYETVKFMDLIAIPKFLAAYGLADVSYIQVTKPYPYLYYRISDLDDSDKMCHYGDTTEKVQGCARSYWASVVPLTAVGPQMSDAKPILRPDKKRFSYITHYPSDCFTNEIFAHETSHLLNDAGEGFTGKYVMDSWLNEQIAGLFGIYGANLACGEGTVTLQRNSDGKDAVKALIEFNSTFAPADLSHKYPKDNICEQAMLTQWYVYLSKGNYQDNYKRFFSEQRNNFPVIIKDNDALSLFLTLDPSSREFLISKGCIL
jgi:hypothetical protein